MHTTTGGSQPSDSVLDELVVAYLERVESGEQLDLERYCSSNGEHAHALRQRLIALRSAGLIGDRGGAGAGHAPERLGEFKLFERLGGGGMGVVYRAEQTSLGRTVALKLIRPEQLYFPGARQRFRREVEALAKLAHPGLVPVYTFGEESGVPYFAMELVEGMTLGEVLRALAGRAPETLTGHDLGALVARRAEAALEAPLFAASWPQACLELVRQIALALQHAHERGVLHRDVKPSNVMLTRDGRARLFDFGLALDTGTSRMTRTGTHMGSFAYMAPELLSGAVREVDARADVYALGVTLYELLTLRLPFGDESTDALMRSILDARPALPRKLNPGLSTDAESVCLVAMEREPARRYASAEALARDLDHVLARRPIEARRVGPLVHAARWMQRHPAATAALALVVLGPIAFAIQASRSSAHIAGANRAIESANAELCASLAREQGERERAEANYDRARNAVDFFLGRLGQTELENVPQMTGLRRELLDEALALYEELLRDKPTDAHARVQQAVNHRSRGTVLRLLGRFEEAEAAFAIGIEQLEPLLADAAVADEAVQECAVAHVSLANLVAQRGRRVEARVHYQTALGELRELVARAPQRTRTRLELVTTLRNLAWLDEDEGRVERAHESYDHAEALLRPLLEGGAPSNEVRSLLADIFSARASIDWERGDLELAVERYERALELQEDLVASEPSHRAWRKELAETCSNLPRVLAQVGRHDDGLALRQRALELARGLERDFPGEPQYARMAGISASNLANAYFGLQDLDSARPLLEEARERLEELHRTHPEFIEHSTMLASVFASLSQVARVDEDLDLASRHAERALELASDAASRNPDAPEVRMQLALTTLAHADIARAKGDHAAAVRGLVDQAALFDSSAKLSLDAAGVWSLCVELAEEDVALSEEERASLANEYLERGLASVRRALELELRDVMPLRESSRLERLRREPQFDALLSSFGMRED